MKHFTLIFLFSTIFTNSFPQNIFNIGLDYFEKGNYFKADSIFNMLIEESPTDMNVRFNYGVTRLYLGDTCKFCDQMLILCNSFQQREACDFYFKFCGTSDTAYFDQNLLKCDKKKARYTEITETHKRKDFKTVFVHDKKKKGVSIITGGDLINPVKTDIIASYELFQDNNRLFLFTTTPPTFIDGDASYSDYLSSNPYIKECKQKLNLTKLIVGVEYVVDKIGNIRDIKITGLSRPNEAMKNTKDITELYVKTTIDDMDTLKKYIDLIVAGMPRRNPAKFRDENVDYLINGTIALW